MNAALPAKRNKSLKLMAVLAHPDDESLGLGGILAKYAAQGIETYLVTATGGERGWFADEEEYPGPEALARIREQELREAAEVLGIRELALLGYRDGELDQADPSQVTGEIVAHLRRVRPQVVVTFDPNGAYGHPDHIAICQFATAAVVVAADPVYSDVNKAKETAPHTVSKLYYMAETQENLEAYQAAFGELVTRIDGQERRATGWKPWAITTRVDASDYWEQVWEAIACHRSQLPGYRRLKALPAEQHQNLWGSPAFYRVFSLVNGGRELERDLFEGLR